ncbi:MAG: ATPase, partial [Altibacter sp.]|nr:ATPase [Altibacter sp.]
MISPKAPYNEAERLAELHSYNLLDTLPEVDYDNITALIASICDVPISLVTLLDKDRNFLKSHFGLDIQESPRDISFCGHAILNDNDLFIVEDARKDERFYDNPIIEEYG